MKSILTCVLLLLKTVSLFPQDLNTNFFKFKNYEPDPKYLGKLCLGYDSIAKSIPFSEKKEYKVIKEALVGVKSNLLDYEKEELLMKNDTISKYLQKMVNKIQQKNSILVGKKFNVFIYRTKVPNAANYGNGIILFNLNLLAKFPTEENVAFILCHEMGHDLKGHIIEGLRKNYELQNSPELKMEYEKIKRQDFNKYKSYEAYAANFLNKFTTKKRDLEIQADSIGLVLYYNTGYNLSGAYQAMQKLDSVDKEVYTAKINYAKFFDFPNFPFKSSWIQQEDEDETIDGGNVKDIKYPDSLKTHPDCKKRLEYMKNIKFAERASTPINTSYTYLYHLSQFEMLEVYMEDYELSKGFYNALQLADKYPNNQYLKCSILDFLFEIYESKIKHYFSVCTDRQDKKYCESYQESLNFINNANSEALKNILENYFKANFKTAITDPYSGYVFTLLKSIGKKKDELLALTVDYEKNFGRNDYLFKLKSKFDTKK